MFFCIIQLNIIYREPNPAHSHRLSRISDISPSIAEVRLSGGVDEVTDVPVLDGFDPEHKVESGKKGIAEIVVSKELAHVA